MTPFMLLDADSNLAGQERAQHILLLEKSKLIEYIDQKLNKISTLPDAIKKSREEQLNKLRQDEVEFNEKKISNTEVQ